MDAGFSNMAALTQLRVAQYQQAMTMQRMGQMPMMGMQSPMMGGGMYAQMGMGYNSMMGMGWGGFMGGVQGMGGMMGMGGMYGQMGMQGGMMMNNFAYPGPNAMGMTGMAGMGMMGQMDNTIEVAGKGMGQETKYKMFAGELLAVNSLLTEKDNQSPEALQKALMERYGMDTEIKDIEGRKALVNKMTGNTVMRDGDGNNLMGKADQDFAGALKTVQERFGITPEQFTQMYDKSKGGVGATTGMNIPQMGMGVMGAQGMQGGMGGMMNPYMGMGGMNPYGGMGGMNPYGGMGGMNPYGGMGMGMGMGQMGGTMAGIWGDPIWQNSIMGVFSGAMRYAGMYGGGMGMGY
jgi:hypothetical protein